MFPRIEIIGRIDSKEDIGPGQSEGRLMLSVMFRSGAAGAFRVICRAADMRALTLGDDVLIIGELDELGAIRLLHGGMIRKLAPMQADVRHDVAPTAAAETTAARPIVLPSPPTPEPSIAAVPAPAPADPRPAASAGTAPKSPFAWKSPFGKPFGAAKPGGTPRTTASASSPAPSPAPASTHAPAPVSAQAAIHAFQPAKPQGFGTTNASFRTGTTATGGAKDAPKATAQPKPPAKRSELAELLQDEIPW